MSITGLRGFAATVSIAMVLFAAGCGSSSKSVTAPSTPEQLKADKAIATQAVLKLSDLPPGYKGTPHAASSGDDVPTKVEQKFLACSHLPKRFVNDSNDDQPNVDAPDFAKGEISQGAATQIYSSVEIDRSSKDISEPLAYLAKKSTARCFQPFFHAAFTESLKGDTGVSIRGVTVESISSGAAGDQGAGFQGRVTVVGPAASIPVYFDMFFVRTGRAVVMLSCIGFREPVGLDFEHQLLATMVDRLKGAT